MRIEEERLADGQPTAGYGAITLQNHQEISQGHFCGRKVSDLTNFLRNLNSRQITAAVVVVVAPILFFSLMFLKCPTVVDRDARVICYITGPLLAILLLFSAACACLPARELLDSEPWDDTPLLPVMNKGPNPNSPTSGGAEALVSYQGTTSAKQPLALRSMEMECV